jgi:hypothetical protein
VARYGGEIGRQGVAEDRARSAQAGRALVPGTIDEVFRE